MISRRKQRFVASFGGYTSMEDGGTGRMKFNPHRIAVVCEGFCAREVKKPNLKMRYYPLLLLAVLLPLAAVAASSSTVFGQSYNCGVQVGSVAANTQYSQGSYYGQSGSYNVQMTVPISTNCPGNGAQLWAVGNAYDTTSNSNVGSANVVMNSNNGYYAANLVFTLPSSIIEHLLQVQITVYNSYSNGQYAGIVATSSPTVTIHASSMYYPPSNSYNNGNNNGYSYSNGYCNGYPCGYYNGYYYYSYQSNPYYYYYYNGYPYYYSYPYYYYYYSYPSNYNGSCFNGQTIIYYNGAYYYASCYYSSYGHHHH
jgi:hypothetical protein